MNSLWRTMQTERFLFRWTRFRRNESNVYSIYFVVCTRRKKKKTSAELYAHISYFNSPVEVQNVINFVSLFSHSVVSRWELKAKYQTFLIRWLRRRRGQSRAKVIIISHLLFAVKFFYFFFQLAAAASLLSPPVGTTIRYTTHRVKCRCQATAADYYYYGRCGATATTK